MRSSTTGCVAVAGALLGVAGIASGSQAEKLVHVGFAAPLTGPQAHYGKEFENGIVLAVERFNQEAAVIGGQRVRIVLDVADDAADPRTATTVAQKFVDDGVVGVLGHFNSGTTIPASRVYAQAGIPEIALATAAAYTQQGFKTAFRMMTSDDQQGAVDGRYAVQSLGWKRIAIIDDRTAYGEGLADRFAAAARQAGAQIVTREYTSDKAIDFKGMLTRLKELQIDGIFYGGADTQAAPMTKQMRELGMKTPLMAGEMIKSSAFLSMAGKAAEGTVASLAGQPLATMPGGPAYSTAYEKRYGEPVQTYSPYGYDGAMAMLTAMKQAKSTEPKQYLPYLKNIDMAGVTSDHFAYDANGNLRHGSITLYQVKNGAWEALSTVPVQ